MYLETRVVATLELTIFLADIVDGRRLRNGEPFAEVLAA